MPALADAIALQALYVSYLAWTTKRLQSRGFPVVPLDREAFSFAITRNPLPSALPALWR